MAARRDFGIKPDPCIGANAGIKSSLRVLGAGLVALSLIGGAPAARASAGASRIIELFTSQGCPNCPAADRLITDLSQDPDTIALSFAVSTWDYIGWKDTLASPAFTERQHAYAAGRGDRRIFTPQVIVDGIGVQPGADRSAILRDGAALAGQDGAMRAPLSVSDDGHMLHIAIGHAPADMAPTDMAKDGQLRDGQAKESLAGVYVLRVARAKTVQIDRGENSGRSVTYTNAVRAMKRIGDWTGKPVTFDLIDLKGDGEDDGLLTALRVPIGFG